MKTSILRSQFYLPRHTNLTTHTANPPFFFPTKTTLSYQKHPTNLSTPPAPSKPSTLSRQTPLYPTKTTHTDKPLSLELIPRFQIPSKEELSLVSLNGHSRFVILGTVSLGFALFLMGMDDQRALALGPEGPLMEEFWDNVRRYGLYILTVSTGALYTIFQPILELLKNPISAVLIITIIGGSFFIVSQILSAMIGVTEFSYDHGY
ncbi:hypothetical protein L1049_009558 [Liquidambar formosana]|uniref:Uncharacterized protein ycf33 n=1 Tax=Liquidambar formosana TaxID=63359 RepID=A0AAP0N9S4_LIQFO